MFQYSMEYLKRCLFVSFCIFMGLNAYKMLLDLGKFKCLLFH